MSSVLSSTAVASSSVGLAMSLSADGKSVIGAGTSVYKDALALNPPCPKFLNIDTLYDSSFLYTYVEADTGARGGDG